MFSIKAAMGKGWEKFFSRPWYLVGVASATIVLMAATSTEKSVATALSYIAYGGYVILLLNFYKGKKVQFDDIFDIDKRWIYFAFLGVIKGFLVLFGLMLFVVPGIYLATRWVFAELFVLDKGMRPLEALKASSELTEGIRLKLFSFMLVTVLFMLLGLLLFVIGVIPALIIVTFAWIHVYSTLVKSAAKKQD